MSGFNINSFRTQGFVNNGVRPALFAVNLTFPTIVETPNLPQRVNFLCRAARAPESIIGTVEVPYFGRTIKLSGDRQFDPWEVRIMMDDYQIRDAFEAWHNAINTIISNRMDEGVANPNPSVGQSYKTVATVTSFKQTGPGNFDGDGAIKTYEFDGIFPTRVDPVQFDWDNKNQIAEFAVEFAYDWWIPRTNASSPPTVPVELAGDA